MHVRRKLVISYAFSLLYFLHEVEDKRDIRFNLLYPSNVHSVKKVPEIGQ